MIHNDISRSFEFIRSPVVAGKMARELHLSWSSILSLIFICTAASQLASIFSASVMYEFVNSSFAEILSDPSDAPTLEQIMSLYEWNLRNPIFGFVLSFFAMVAFIVLLAKLGVYFGERLEFEGVVSALSRFSFVYVMLSSAFTFLVSLSFALSSDIGAGLLPIRQMLFWVMFFWSLYVIKGIFNFRIMGQSLVLIVGAMLTLLVALTIFIIIITGLFDVL